MFLPSKKHGLMGDGKVSFLMFRVRMSGSLGLRQAEPSDCEFKVKDFDRKCSFFFPAYLAC